MSITLSLYCLLLSSEFGIFFFFFSSSSLLNPLFSSAVIFFFILFFIFLFLFFSFSLPHFIFVPSLFLQPSLLFFFSFVFFFKQSLSSYSPSLSIPSTFACTDILLVLPLDHNVLLFYCRCIFSKRFLESWSCPCSPRTFQAQQNFEPFNR